MSSHAAKAEHAMAEGEKALRKKSFLGGIFGGANKFDTALDVREQQWAPSLHLFLLLNALLLGSRCAHPCSLLAALQPRRRIVQAGKGV